MNIDAIYMEESRYVLDDVSYQQSYPVTQMHSKAHINDNSSSNNIPYIKHGDDDYKNDVSNQELHSVSHLHSTAPINDVIIIYNKFQYYNERNNYRRPSSSLSSSVKNSPSSSSSSSSHNNNQHKQLDSSNRSSMSTHHPHPHYTAHIDETIEMRRLRLNKTSLSYTSSCDSNNNNLNHGGNNDNNNNSKQSNTDDYGHDHYRFKLFG